MLARPVNTDPLDGCECACSGSTTELLSVDWLLLTIVIRSSQLAEGVAVAIEAVKEAKVLGAAKLLLVLVQVQGVVPVGSLTVVTIDMEDGRTFAGAVLMIILDVAGVGAGRSGDHRDGGPPK